MPRSQKPSTDQLKKLAKKIRTAVFDNIHSYKTTIFLCGARRGQLDSVREKIATALTSGWYMYFYDIVYPEDLFDELMLGPRHVDLMTMENILAESVDAIVLVPESHGAVAELGAFASNDDLRKKLICVQDIKYKKKKSFINYGPIRLIRKEGRGHLVYVDFQSFDDYFQKIRTSISKISKASTKVKNITNVLQTENFVLPCIYLFEPVKRELLMDLVRFASRSSKKKATVATAAAISILRKKKMILSSPDGYRLTEAGITRFTNLSKQKKTQLLFDFEILDPWSGQVKLLTI